VQWQGREEVAQAGIGLAKPAGENPADVLEDDHVSVIVLFEQPVQV
jgi:hypothetical protein